MIDTNPKNGVDMKVLFLVFSFLNLSFAFANSNLTDLVNSEMKRSGEVYLVCKDIDKLDVYKESYNNFSIALVMEAGKSDFSYVTISKYEGQFIVPPSKIQITDSRLNEGIFVFGSNELKIDLISKDTFRPKFNAELFSNGQSLDDSMYCFVNEVATGE